MRICSWKKKDLDGFGIKQRSISPSETGDFEFFRFNMIFFHQNCDVLQIKNPMIQLDITGYQWVNYGILGDEPSPSIP